MINDEANEVIKELFDSLKNRYQNNLESMKGSEFVFDYVNLFYKIVLYILYCIIKFIVLFIVNLLYHVIVCLFIIN